MPEEEKISSQESQLRAAYKDFQERYHLDPMIFAFGPTVKVLHEKLGQRWIFQGILKIEGAGVLPELSSRKLIAALKDLDEDAYPISSGAFSSIESGNSLPRDPETFMKAISKTLHIDENSEEYLELSRALTFTATLRDAGAKAAWEYLWDIIGLKESEYANSSLAKERFVKYIAKREALLRDGYLPKGPLHPSRRYGSFEDLQQ